VSLLFDQIEFFRSLLDLRVPPTLPARQKEFRDSPSRRESAGGMERRNPPFDVVPKMERSRALASEGGSTAATISSNSVSGISKRSRSAVSSATATNVAFRSPETFAAPSPVLS
jgi:hypothetical protein